MELRVPCRRSIEGGRQEPAAHGSNQWPPAPLFFDCRLVDQHYRDVIAYRIDERTFGMGAFQRTLIGLQFDFRLAFRTAEYFYEFWANCHFGSPQASCLDFIVSGSKIVIRSVKHRRTNMKNLSLMLILAILALVGLACNLGDRLDRFVDGDQKFERSTELWSDVPRIDGLSASEMEMPLAIKVIMRT